VQTKNVFVDPERRFSIYSVTRDQLMSGIFHLTLILLYQSQT